MLKDSRARCNHFVLSLHFRILYGEFLTSLNKPRLPGECDEYMSSPSQYQLQPKDRIAFSLVIYGFYAFQVSTGVVENASHVDYIFNYPIIKFGNVIIA